MPIGSTPRRPRPGDLAVRRSSASCCGSSWPRPAGGTHAARSTKSVISPGGDRGSRRVTDRPTMRVLLRTRAVAGGVRHRDAPQRHVVHRRRAAVSSASRSARPTGMMRPGPDNPKGYFEVQAIMQLDDEMLAHLGGAWDQPPVLDPGWEHERGARTVPGRGPARSSTTPSVRRPSGRPLIAWKDPRLSLLLPFWRTVTPIATTIVVVRDPVEVVASLGARELSGWRVAGREPLAALPLRGDRRRSRPSPRAPHRHLRRPPRHGRAARESPRAPGARRRRRSGGARPPRHRACAITTRERAAPELDNPLLDLARAVWNGGDVDLESRCRPLVGRSRRRRVGSGRRSTASCSRERAPTSSRRGRRSARPTAGSRRSRPSSLRRKRTEPRTR